MSTSWPICSEKWYDRLTGRNSFSTYVYTLQWFFGEHRLSETRGNSSQVSSVFEIYLLQFQQTPGKVKDTAKTILNIRVTNLRLEELISYVSFYLTIKRNGYFPRRKIKRCRSDTVIESLEKVKQNKSEKKKGSLIRTVSMNKVSSGYSTT